MDKWSGWDSFSNMDKVANGTIGVEKLQPYVHSHTLHMNLLGFLRLYSVTGDEALLKKVKGVWDDVCRRQMYITGGVSVAEHYEAGYIKPITGNVVETCATMSWMQLTQALLEVTGETKYAEAMERLMINHVFAAQDVETGVCCYHTAPNGTKPEGYLHGPDCCTASGHRIISLIPTFFFAENEDNFYINQYLPCQYSGKDFGFELTGNYPESEYVEVTITSDKKKDKTVNLRIPQWCKAPRITLNGKILANIQPGTYLKLTHKWAKGDKIKIFFPMESKWVKREHHSDYAYDRLPGGEMMYREVATDKTPYALQRGPMVYALDMVWNKQVGDDVDLGIDIRINTQILPTEIDKPDVNMVGPAYKANALYKGEKVEVTLTPFTTIGQCSRPGEPKPNRYTDTFTYGVWIYGMEEK